MKCANAKSITIANNSPGTILRPHNQLAPLLPLCQHHRTLLERFFGRKEPKKGGETDSQGIKSKSREKDQPQKPKNNINSGGLAPSTILEDEIKSRRNERRKGEKSGQPFKPEIQDWRDLKPTRRDPDPKKRLKWERRKITQSVRHRFRITDTEKLLRSERSSLSMSPKIKTSIKKLGPLARQIAGKPLTEAMIQMRFSKKRAAADLLKHLQYARNQAIVQREMGLGKAVPRPDANGREKNKGGPEEKIVLEDKKGKQREITDPSAIYIDQAWVGRATPEYGTDFRARGRAHRLTLPYTSKYISQLVYSHLKRPNRMLSCFCFIERRSNKDKGSEREGAETTEKKGLGTIAGSACHSAKAVSVMVRSTFYGVNKNFP